MMPAGLDPHRRRGSRQGASLPRSDVTLDQPQAAAPNRAAETRTPLNAVFRRLSGGPAAPANSPKAPIEPPPGPTETPAVAPIPAPEAPPVAAELAPQAEAGAPAAAAAPHFSLAAALLARAGAAIAARSAGEPAFDRARDAGLQRTPAAAAKGQDAGSGEPAAPPPRPAMPVRRGLREAAPPDWPVPNWLAVPVLGVAIPNSPFGWGSEPQAGTPPARGPVRKKPPDRPPGGPEELPAATPSAAPSAGADFAAVAAPRRLLREVGAVGAAVQPRRAERPLGAPQSALRISTGGAGLPATEIPAVIVEPQIDPAAAGATGPAAEAPRDGRTMIRNRRLYRRVRLDVGFEVDGAARDLFDLSMGGFAAAPGAPLERDKTVTVSLRLAIDGVDIRTRLRARVIYANAVRCGGRFVDLTASQTAFLRYVVTRRGEPAGALGTTTLLNAIDQPGRPERSSAPQPADEPARKAPWWSRWLGRLRGKRNPIQ